MFLDFFRVTPSKRKIKFKKTHGVLFSNPGFWGKTVFYTGTWLFALSLVYAVYLYWPIAAAFGNYWMSLRLQTSRPEIAVLPTPTPVLISQRKHEYTITIPKILAFSKIVDNISPFDPKQYLKVLEDNVVAQAKDTSYPGMGPGHTTYIFAHSTEQGLSMLRKNAVFYLLGELKNGDTIFVDRNGINYTYRVYKQVIVKANQIEYLKYTEPDKEILILQTCWPVGTDWNRLLILADSVQ
jgi:LPXTG-site transpeptidase (sortase) family protein